MEITKEQQTLYDKTVAETMWLLNEYFHEKCGGKNVVYVHPESKESLFLLHCAMNCGSAFNNFPVYIDTNSIFTYWKIKWKYRKFASIKRAKGNMVGACDFSIWVIRFNAENRGSKFEGKHHLNFYAEIYDAYYKGDSKW